MPKDRTPRNTPISALLLCIAMANQAPAAVQLQRQDALSLARSVNSAAIQQVLLDLSVAGSTADVLALLQDTTQRGDWPAPARDAAVYGFAQDLRSLPRSAVPGEVLTWLGAYQPLTMVPHEDHAGGWVPLFNVRAVAVGVENDWRRQDAVLEGLALIATQPRSLVDAWLLDPDPASRMGYSQALEQARPAQLQEVGKHARRQLQAHPELTALAGQAALLSDDLESLGEVFALGGGAELAPLMRQCAARLAPAASATLLDSTLAMAPQTNAALAIAELAPAAAGLPSTQQLLLDHLGDRQLGATAALALARVASDESVEALRLLAEDSSGASAHNARLALELLAPGQEQGD